MKLLKGEELAAEIAESLPARIAALPHVPVLGIVRVGERPDDLAYERGAKKRMEKLGLNAITYAFPADIPEEDFIREFRKINEDKGVDGILLMRPLPKQIDGEKVLRVLDPEKDLDGISPENIARVFRNDLSGFAPAVAEAAVRLIKTAGIPLRGARVTIVGRSEVVGRPLMILFLRENATVTVCHTKTTDLPARCREADVIVSCAGRRNLIGRDCVKPGAAVIDVGINVDENGKLCGDVSFDEVKEIASVITPVPGGVGSATSSVLAEHLVTAAERRAAKEENGTAAEETALDLREETLCGFAEKLWSSAPAPGGGGAAAYTAALGASLAGMVANLTVGKKQYEDVWPAMNEISEKAAELRDRLLQAVNEDAVSFTGYMEALKLPKNTEEERNLRREKMQEELKKAAQVPIGAAETALEVFDLADEAVRLGNRGLVTDGLIAAMEAKTAVSALILNVRVNLGAIRDQEFAEKLGERCDALEQRATEREEIILTLRPDIRKLTGR